MINTRRSQMLFACAFGLGVVLCAALSVAILVPAFSQAQEDEAEIAKSLAMMLRAGRTVISRHQDRINDASLGYKGLDARTVLAESSRVYQEAMKVDPSSIDPKTRHGKLIRILIDSIAEVIDVHQRTLNRQGVGFKGFIPAVFARLVNEAFGRRAAGIAEIKVTAPPYLIRNARALPDAWEAAVISDKLQSAGWPQNQPYASLTQSKGRAAFRTAVPEYYGNTCLSCHGSPKGEVDITGYPKDGAGEGDLGGVISITLYH